MIKNSKTLLRFEKELLKRESVDTERNFKFVEALYDEAVALGVIPLKNPLDELNVDISIEPTSSR